jgi:signal transduction histidine kinase
VKPSTEHERQSPGSRATAQPSQQPVKRFDRLDEGSTPRLAAGSDVLAAYSPSQLEEIEALVNLGRWVWDIATGTLTASPQLIRIFALASPGLMPNSESFLLRVHQSDRTRVRASIMRALSTGEPFQFQHRAVRMDHEIRVLRTRGTIERGEDGNPVRIIGLSQDITEQHAADKRAQMRLMQMARRALDREERDRTQIVKALREQVTEPLIAVGRKLVALNTEESAPEKGAATAQISECIQAVNAAGAATLQVIGHLRPSVLEQHGLLAALRAEALRVGRQAAIPVSVSGEEIAPRLSPGAETALFRLAQEAIANSARHAGCTLIRISLTGTAAHARLEIQDNGSGFDVTTVAGSETGEYRGITLMRERAEAISASFRLSSQPGTGAKITVDYRG